MKHKVGDLQVWWIPQVPGKPFKVSVSSVAEGVKIMDTLAKYDLFQFKHHIKPDYSNAGGLQRWCDNGPNREKWEDWEDQETGEDYPKEWLRSQAG